MLDILKRPHYKFWVHWDPVLIPFFIDLETRVPGALCYAKTQGRWKGTRYRDADGSRPQTPGRNEVYDYTEVITAVLGASYVSDVLTEAGVSFRAIENMVGYEDMSAFPIDAQQYAEMVETGRALMQETTLLYPRTGFQPHPWQFAGVTWARDRPAVLKTWPCGKGKCLGFLMDVESRGYLESGVRVAITPPTAAEGTWWREIRKHAGIDPFIHRPKSRTKPSDETLSDWLARCRANKWPEIHIFGLESLADWREDIEQLKPHVMGVDELHECANPKRWKIIPGQDGSIQYEVKETDNGNELRSVALLNIARIQSIEFRGGLSATPLGEGRARRLFAPIDYVWPGGLGYSYFKYAVRYCDRKVDENGYPNDKGTSNIIELKDRCAWFEHEVTIEEARRGATADAIWDVVFLEPHALVKEGRYSDQETYSQAIRRLGMEAEANPMEYQRKASLIEARLAQAASRKRKWVIDEAVRCIQGGGKFVIFTTRILESEIWAEQITRALTNGDLRRPAPVWVCHGEKPDREIDSIVEDIFPQHVGPCGIVGTLQKIGRSKNGMHMADLMTCAQLPWQADQLEQAFGRGDRPGGPMTVFKVPIAVGSYDETVALTLSKKLSVVDAFMRSGHLSGVRDQLTGMEDDDTMMAKFLASCS